MTTSDVSTPLEPVAGPSAPVLDGLILHSAQLIRITRHPSIVIPVAGPGVHVITGQGPRGASNGAGKTNVVAALLLACADQQWTRSNAGAKAVGLLFSERDAQQPAGSHGDATHGYIMTAWVDPAAPARTAVTVMMRIHRAHRDHLQVRTRQGVWFAVGRTETERLLDADRQWNELGGGVTLGPTQYGTALFGTAPGSVGYVSKRGADDRGDTGLLSVVDGRRFAPRDLARELIDLCGVADQIALEQHHRKRHKEFEDELLTAEHDHRQASILEDQEKTDIEARLQSKKHRDQAETEWLCYLAAGLRDCTERHEAGRARQTRRRQELHEKQLRRDEYERAQRSDALSTAASRVHAAKQAKDHAHATHTAATERCGALTNHLDALDAQLRTLSPALTIAGQTTVEQAETEVAQADEGVARARARHERLLSECADATADLDATQQGLGGDAGRISHILRDHDISAAPLVDLIELADTQRAYWEPRLAPLGEAVIVDRSGSRPGERADHTATEVLTDYPGTQLLILDEVPTAPRTPGGQGTHPLDPVLEVLAARYTSTSTHPHPTAADTELGLIVTGGFEHPQTGRAARVRAAQARLDRLRADLADAETASGQAQHKLTLARQLLRAVQEARQHADLTTEYALSTAVMREASTTRDHAAEQLAQAEDELQSANNELTTATVRQKDAGQQLKRLDNEITELRKAIADDNTDTYATAADSFRHALGADLAQANDLLANATETPTATPDELRNRAAAELRHAITVLTDTPPRDDAIQRSDPLATQLYALFDWADKPNAPAQERPQPFHTKAAALDGWLRAHGRQDAHRLQEIERIRAARQRDLEATEKRLRQNQDVAASAARSAKTVIRTQITSVEKQLRTLWAQAGRDAINLHPTPTEPQTPEEPVTWELNISWQDSPDVPPRRYTDQINTAERVVIHTLLAVAALATQSNPRGRVVVIDEFGQNFDLRTVSEVAETLHRIAVTVGLTILLSCQDIYATLIAEHSQTLIEVRHPNERDALNAPPHITLGPLSPEIIELFGDYWTTGRPVL